MSSMDRLRRFEKIERVREERVREERDPKEPEPPAQLPRFEEPPVPYAVAQAQGPPAVPTLESLILALPTLECPACNAENSKFSRACRSCGHPLDGDDALAHNARRLEQQEVDRLKAEVELERRLARSAPLAAPEATRPSSSAWSRLPPPPGARLTAGLGAGLVLLALLARSSAFSMLCMLCALGLGAWKVLGSREP